MADGDTFSGIGYARACMVDIHVHVEICTAGGEWGYILWDRLGLSMHFVQFSLIMTTANTSFPGTFMYSSFLL